METENLTALDDVTLAASERLIPNAAFSPPVLADSQFKQLELLQHLSLYSELLIFVSADSGMGKTFIANALLASREAPDQSLMLKADFSLSYVDILHKLAVFLDLADLADDIESIENQILSRCLQISDDDQGSLLVIIDQADQLSDETLEEVNHLALLATNALHIMIIAKPELEQQLIELPEPQAPVHVMAIEPLAEQEAEMLLLQSFPEQEWSAEDVDYILQQGVGNPGKILYVAQQLLAGVKPAAQKKLLVKFPITHIAAMLLVASALVMSYFYQHTLADKKPNTNGLQVNIGIVTTAEKVSDVSALDANFEQAINQNELGLTSGSLISEGKVSIEEEVDFNFNEPEASSVKDSAAIDVIAESSTENTNEIGSAKTEVVVEQFKPLTKTYTYDERILLEAVDNNFIIQLFASYSMKNAKGFVNKYKSSQNDLHIYKAEYKSKPWFVVVSGPYASKIAASSQAKKLPKELRQQNPWIRSIQAIQQLLKERD